MVSTNNPIASSSYDYLMKMIIIGESGTGKSCLLHQFIHGIEKDNPTQTIGVEFSSKLIQCGEKSIKLQLWDTAGQERFRSVTKSYYRGASACLLVFDITRRNSFENLNQWLKDARNLCSPELIVAIIGNKIDQESKRQVSSKEAKEWSNENNAIYFETSSLNGLNVEKPFEFVCNFILNEIKIGKIDPQQSNFGISFGDKGLKSVTSASSTTTTRLGKTNSKFLISESSNSIIDIQQSNNDKNSFRQRCCS